MAFEKLRRADLVGRIIDGHTHAGVSLKAYAAGEYPYAQTIEGLHGQQLAGGVDATVVFPFTADLYFDPAGFAEGILEPAAAPLSPVPYCAENRMIMREVYDYCPELSRRFLPFVSVDPARDVPGQIKALEKLLDVYPAYGIKVNPVGCQSKASNFMGIGAPFLAFAEERGLPLLFHVTTLPGEEYSQASDVFKIVDRHPRLRFCMAHSLLFHRAWLERAASTPNVWVDTAAIKIQVESVRGEIGRILPAGEFLDVDYTDYRAVMCALCALYPRKIIWGTDSPAYSWITRRKEAEGIYREFRLKGSYSGEIAALKALPLESQGRVGGGNALDFLFGPE